MQKIKFDKQIIIFLSLAVVLIVELIVLLPWGIKRAVTLQKKITLLGQKITITQADWPRLDEYLETKNKLELEIEKSQLKFILSEEASKALSFISAASKEFGVEIKSFVPESLISYSAEGNQNLFYLPIDIKAKAKFHNLALFLEHLQNSHYFFDVKKLKIVSKQPYNSLEIVLCGIVEK